jgi:hypothetical protein
MPMFIEPNLSSKNRFSRPLMTRDSLRAVRVDRQLASFRILDGGRSNGHVPGRITVAQKVDRRNCRRGR